MKLNVSKKYIKKLRKVLKLKLNGGNLVSGVNTWAVSLLRYSAAGQYLRQTKEVRSDQCWVLGFRMEV